MHPLGGDSGTQCGLGGWATLSGMGHRWCHSRRRMEHNLAFGSWSWEGADQWLWTFTFAGLWTERHLCHPLGALRNTSHWVDGGAFFAFGKNPIIQKKVCRANNWVLGPFPAPKNTGRGPEDGRGVILTGCFFGRGHCKGVW